MNPKKTGGKAMVLTPEETLPDNRIRLAKEDIVMSYWRSGKLHVVTKGQGALVFGCPREQQQMTNALRHLGIKVAPPPMTKAQQWLTGCHYLVNTRYFGGILPTPLFEVTEHPNRYEAWYNVDRRAIGFSKSAYAKGFDNSARWATHTMIHECVHQFVHLQGWQPVKGLDPHLEQGFVDMCALLTIMLGLPSKREFTLNELKGFPQTLIHEDYYYYRTDTIRPAYNW